jgi:hypothetical protein
VTDGTPVGYWRHALPQEPLPEGLAIGSDGQVVVTTIDGHVLSLAPKPPRPAPGASDRVRD